MHSTKKVFIGYAKEDKGYADTLKKHLNLLERQGLIQIWDESMITTGEIHKTKIVHELKTADLILLLFSPDLLAQDFIWGAEMKQILDNQRNDNIVMIPIAIRLCEYSDLNSNPFARYTSIPEWNNPISNWKNKNEAWISIQNAIKLNLKNKINTSSHNPFESMISLQLKEKVNNLIGEGKIEEGIDAIIKWAHENNQNQLKNDAAVLKGKLSILKRNEILGMLSFAESSRESTILSNGVLELLKVVQVPPPEMLVLGEKLKILLLAANPAKTTKLNLDKEHSQIVVKLQGKMEQFDLIFEKSVDVSEFQEYTETIRPNILHFSGHAEDGGEDGGLLVHNDYKNGYVMIPPKGLNAMFKYFKEEGINFKAVVLNACYSYEQAQIISKYVPYVIGTTVEIGDDFAIKFSRGFYFKLDSGGNNIEQAFKSGRTQAVAVGADETHFVLYKAGQKIDI